MDRRTVTAPALLLRARELSGRPVVTLDGELVAEIKDIVGRLDIAIKRAMDGFPRDVDVRESSSLSIGDRPIAAE